MRSRFNPRGVAALAALIGLAIVGSFATADAGYVGHRSDAISAKMAAADFSAARKQRHARRPPSRSNADPVASQPQDRPSFGYGIGDNSRYGGG